ncbi:MAG: hypothetical protein ACTH8F_13935 [Microbacterium sp.]|uniref:hypothetical protein n=1 Tax=Microbacterium sp. TaxID=51671 RepID=UPI003F97319B
MRRALRRLTVGAAATSLALLLPPAFAKGGVDLDLGDDGGSANVKVEVTDPGSGGDKSSGAGGSSSGGGKSSGGDSSSSGGSKSSGNSGKSSGGGGGGGTTSVSNSGRTSVGNYSSGSPSSVSSNRPDNVEVLDDGSRATYYPEGAYVQGQNGGPTAFVDGMTQAQPDPADPPAPAPPPAQDPAPQGAGEAPAPQVDPAELAQTALSQMGLEAPEIASTPNDTETLGAVGLPVWFWVSNPGETTTGPNTTSASAGAATVTATATFSGMSIDMGDGTTIECEGPGTEYPGTGIDPSPDCGHIYEQMSDEQPNGLYTVNITAHWGVEWESNTGESGTIPVELTTSKQLRIGQYQTVVTDVS